MTSRISLFFLLVLLASSFSHPSVASSSCTKTSLHGCSPGCWNPDDIFVGDDEINCIPVGAGYYSPADSDQRFACPSGHVSLFETAAECIPCRPGSMATPDGKSCILCPTFSYQDEASQTICKPCDSVRYKGEGANAVSSEGSCLLIDDEIDNNNNNDGGGMVDRPLTEKPPTCVNTPGTCGAGCWNDDGLVLDNGKRLCVAVEPGYYSPADSNHRLECEKGFVSADYQSEECTPCRPGTMAHPSRTGCMPCPKGTYQDVFGGKVCYNCNPDIYSGPGANVMSPDGHCLIKKREGEASWKVSPHAAARENKKRRDLRH